MKLAITVLLVFLFLTASVSAITLNPSTGRIAVTTPPTTAPADLSPVLVPPIATTSPVSPVVIRVTSNPTGAIVTSDGSVASATPLTLILPPGTHTIVVSKDGYKSYTTTLTLTSGMPEQSIMADLKPIEISYDNALLPDKTQETRGVTPAPVQTRPSSVAGIAPVTPEPTSSSGHRTVQTTTLGVPAGVTLVTTTAVPVVCPNADWICTTPGMAAYMYGDVFARYGDDPCGYTETEGTAEYCYMDLDDKNFIGGTINAAGFTEEKPVYLVNDTIYRKLKTKNAVMKSGQNPASTPPWQGFFDFFAGIVSGGSVKPDARLTIIGFNPQPEPPAKPVSDLEKVGLNPQPEPPAQGPAGNT
jgi:hypothetical protein